MARTGSTVDGVSRNLEKWPVLTISLAVVWPKNALSSFFLGGMIEPVAPKKTIYLRRWKTLVSHWGTVFLVSFFKPLKSERRQRLLSPLMLHNTVDWMNIISVLKWALNMSPNVLSLCFHIWIDSFVWLIYLVIKSEPRCLKPLVSLLWSNIS